MSFIEVNNSLVSPLEEAVMKEANEEYNNIIIAGPMIRYVLKYQLNKMSAQYKVMCDCDCFIYATSMHSYLLRWCDIYLK